MVSVTQLPVELLVLIATLLDREEWKQLRLTNHAFSAAATVRLFNEIHISPNSHSFDRAGSVAVQAHLKKHVRSLVYHFGTLEDEYAGFDEFKRAYSLARRTGGIHDPYETTPEVLWAYNCWLEEIDGQRTFDLRDEFEELSDLCSQLPRLESIATKMDEDTFYGDHQNYIGKRTGMAANDETGQWRFSNLMMAAVTKPLRKISARCIQWHELYLLGEDLPGHGGRTTEMAQTNLLTTAKRCLSNLSYLELGLYREPADDDDLYPKPEHSSPASTLPPHLLLSSILKHTTKTSNLHTLRLDFDELPCESDAETFLPISQAILSKSNFWPKLTELKLEAICTYQDEFVEFLFAHRTTLRRLYIGDIELVAREEDTTHHSHHLHDENAATTTTTTTTTNSAPSYSTTTAPSILQFFTTLHTFLNLDTCRLTGNFTNRIDQAWYVNTEYDEQPQSSAAGKCIRDQLQRYISGRDRINNDFDLDHEYRGREPGLHADEDEDEEQKDDEKEREITDYFRFESSLQMVQRRHGRHYDAFQDESWQWASELLPDP